MSAQHTPGPWFVDDELQIRAPDELDPQDEPWVVALVAVGCGHPNDQDEANARFIVRAANCHDDLLEAAELALKVIDDDPSVDDWDAACDIIRAAIAKARGTVPTLDKGDM